MRALLPEPELDPDIHDFFAADWVSEGGLRANFVTSTDGAISVSGLSRGLQTPGDNRVFAALRDLADVVVVGASTAQAEQYGPVRPAGDRLARRRRYGLPAALPMAVLSRSLTLDPTAALYTEAADDARTIVLTCAAGAADTRRTLEARAEVVICGDDDVELDVALGALRERGLTRLLCEGGPTLFAALAGGRLVDELCLSLSPLLAGPGSGRLTQGAAWGGVRDLALHGLLEEDGALFGRYRAVSPDRPS